MEFKLIFFWPNKEPRDKPRDEVCEGSRWSEAVRAGRRVMQCQVGAVCDPDTFLRLLGLGFLPCDARTFLPGRALR